MLSRTTEGRLVVTLLSSGFVIVRERGVNTAVFEPATALSSVIVKEVFASIFYSKKCPSVYVVEYTWKSALEVAVVPLSMVRAPRIVVTSPSVGTI